MKLVHWVDFPSTGISGMFGTIGELIEAEMAEIGASNVAVCASHVSRREGGQQTNLRNTVIVSSPWSEVLSDPDVVHIIHTYPAYTLHDLKRKVMINHGIPEYAWWEDLYKFDAGVWWQITTLTRACDAVICWFERDRQFWEEMTDRKVVAIRRGIDLKYWCPTIRNDPMVHPYLLYADATRLMKLPFSLLYGVHKAQKVLPYIYLKLILGEPSQHIGWTNLVTELRMESYIPFVLGLLSDVRQTMRDSDIVFSPTFWGLTPRTVIEGMACGTPAMCFKGSDDLIHGLRVEDSPSDIANGIIKLWDRMVDDGEGERIKARKCAEKYWDVKDTAKAVIKVCQSVY